MLVKTMKDVPLKYPLIEYDSFQTQICTRRADNPQFSYLVIDILMPYFDSLIGQFQSKFKVLLDKVRSNPNVLYSEKNVAITWKGTILYLDVLNVFGAPVIYADKVFTKEKETEAEFLDEYKTKIETLQSDYAFLSMWARSLFNHSATKVKYGYEYQYSLNKWALPMFLKTNPWLEEFLEDNKILSVPTHLKETYTKAENILLKYVSYNLICST